MSQPRNDEALAIFLGALDEWGCEDDEQRAIAIHDFIASGYDLSEYEDRMKLSVIQGGLSALKETDNAG